MESTKEWPYKYSKELLDKIIRRYKAKNQSISYSDAEETINNLVGLYKMLLELEVSHNGEQCDSIPKR